MQVDCRTEDDVDALGTAFARKHLAHALRSSLIPRLGQQRGIGEQRDSLAADELAATDTGRPVAKDHRTESNDFIAAQREGGRASQQLDLGCKIEFAYRAFDHILDRHAASFVSAGHGNCDETLVNPGRRLIRRTWRRSMSAELSAQQ